MTYNVLSGTLNPTIIIIWGQSQHILTGEWGCSSDAKGIEAMLVQS